MLGALLLEAEHRIGHGDVFRDGKRRRNFELSHCDPSRYY
ncbi:hypothetical protein BTZ20_4255 [Rhodococcus sp. MTM3W5.2]|nr:hypothetical protein BTZ20_4255 [Rhodococcus sp. MTM3W5.2]